MSISLLYIYIYCTGHTVYIYRFYNLQRKNITLRNDILYFLRNEILSLHDQKCIFNKYFTSEWIQLIVMNTIIKYEEIGVFHSILA